MDASYRSLNYAFPQMLSGQQNIFQQGSVNQAGQPPAFGMNAGNPQNKLDNYFSDMKQVLGKKPTDNQLSAADFQKYERLLQNSSELLEDTLQFSQRAESPATAKYMAQKQDLMEKLDMTRQMGQFFQQQGPASNNPFNMMA